MERLACTYGLAVLVFWESGGFVAPAAAGEPPPLEPPVVSTPEVGVRRPGDPGAVLRRSGPPRESPADPAGPAPGPDSFYIPGQYVPAGEGFAWRPGFWTRTQPGWEWVPARWVRLAEGWAYRAGHWERAEPVAAAAAPAPPAPTPRRHVVARPTPDTPDPSSPPPPPPANPPVDAVPPTELAPLPENDNAPSVSPPAVQEQEPVPLQPGPPVPDALPANPLIPFGPPITELNLPGVYIRVVPPVTFAGNGPTGYTGVVVPPTQVRVVRPFRGVRQRVRDLIDSVLP